MTGDDRVDNHNWRVVTNSILHKESQLQTEPCDLQTFRDLCREDTVRKIDQSNQFPMLKIFVLGKSLYYFHDRTTGISACLVVLEAVVRNINCSQLYYLPV